jgi:hypothetical protein
MGVDDAKVLHTDIEADSLGEPGRGSRKANPLKSCLLRRAAPALFGSLMLKVGDE